MNPGKSCSAFASIQNAPFAHGLGLHKFVVVVAVIVVVDEVSVMVVSVALVAVMVVVVGVVVEEQIPHRTGQFALAKVPTSIVIKQCSRRMSLPHAGCSAFP